MLTALEPWRRLDRGRRELIEAGLRGLQQGSRSRDCADVLQRMLG